MSRQSQTFKKSKFYLNKFLNEQKRYSIHHTKWKKHHNQSLYYYVTLLYMILWSIRMIVSSIVEKQHETSTHILRPQTPPANMSQFHHPLQLKSIPFIWNCFLRYIVVEWMKTKNIKSALPLSVHPDKTHSEAKNGSQCSLKAEVRK